MPSALSANLGYWLRYVSNHVSQSFARKLADRDVTVAEWTVIRSLYENPPIAPSRLAEQLGMTRGAITKLADRLVAKDYVVRAASPADGRAQTLALTPKGSDLIPTLARLADLNDAEFFVDLTTEERSVLERIMKEIVEKRGLRSVPVD